ncbi:unnamed protein product [Prorocentrum cordatum]|uniref:Uncharacterized protein n=1 Tax=Prorocentrum cordatum TaxID=2364126 RepID=A0ABN9S7U7_9DINO|nr:unnamed protein product [Polarella glacialis]
MHASGAALQTAGQSVLARGSNEDPRDAAAVVVAVVVVVIVGVVFVVAMGALVCRTSGAHGSVKAARVAGPELYSIGVLVGRRLLRPGTLCLDAMSLEDALAPPISIHMRTVADWMALGVLRRQLARLGSKCEELFPDFCGAYEAELKVRDWAFKNEGLISASEALLKADASMHKEVVKTRERERKLNRDLKKDNWQLQRQKRAAEAELVRGGHVATGIAANTKLAPVLGEASGTARFLGVHAVATGPVTCHYCGDECGLASCGVLACAGGGAPFFQSVSSVVARGSFAKAVGGELPQSLVNIIPDPSRPCHYACIRRAPAVVDLAGGSA